MTSVFAAGAVTCRKLTDYITRDRTDFKNARRCINGMDKWAEIKTLAQGYLRGM